MLNVQEVRLASLAPSRLVWLATCHSTRLTHYHFLCTSGAERGGIPLGNGPSLVNNERVRMV